ncbi:ATP-binding cassette domain-containing protein [Streptomyces sp. NPDC002209]|uniref:ATP-binding cassette domain-containing protein n=1 Tax=Streptomyces sp. NPDC002209 TaxID=3364638 RepID=UPI0036A68508
MTTTEPIPALLRANGLRKTYRTGGTEVVAVDGLSFSLPPGGALGIVGESGSGKTTTARMLVGLEAPDAGEILVQGRPLAKAARGKAARLARAKAVQIVFQDPYLSLDARIGIGATLDGVLRLHGSHDRTARAARVRELLAQVGLGDREAAALPRHLSGGQRQRAAIARALAVEPAVLVLDEAVSALDVSVQAQVLNLLADIRRDTGIGLVFVSHDLAVVRYVCDEALVMYRGRTMEHRPVAELLTTPRHPYTRLLLASVPHRGWDPDSISRRRRGLDLVTATS